MSVALQECETVNVYVLVSLLKHVGQKANFNAGKFLHLKAIKTGCDTNKYVATALITMYGRCGTMLHAQAVFDKVSNHDAALWNSLILGYVENGESIVALELFTVMEQEAVVPSTVTYVAVLKALGSLASEKQMEKRFCVEIAVKAHQRVQELGLHCDIFIANTLIDVYSKCGCMHLAQSVFDIIESPQVGSWTNLMTGYADNGKVLKAMDLFCRTDCPPNSVTFVAVIKACVRLAENLDRCFCLWKSVSVHKQAQSLGLDSHFTVANTLIDSYFKLGSIDHAKFVFDGMNYRTVVSWTILIMGYVDKGQNVLALELFSAMDCKPNYVTFVAALKACTGLLSDNKRFEKHFCLEKGLELHKQAREQGFDTHLFLASALVDMYSKCRYMCLARKVFNRMSYRNVVTWNSLILGYANNGENDLVLEQFTEMDCEPDSITFIAVLKACGSLGAVSIGRNIHARIWELGLEKEHLVANCLLDFYGKCGAMEEAEQVFNRMHSKDVITWTALIAGYSLVGDTEQVFRLVKRMQECGVEPNATTYLLVLTACSHTGHVEEGRELFEWMVRCGVKVTAEHFTCMVDMFGRANRLEEALGVIRKMPFQGNCVVWRTLLGACRKWNNVKVGEEAFGALLECGKEVDAAPGFVMMGDLYKM